MKNESLRSSRAVIKLQAYKGKKTYDENGNVASTNQKLTLIYGSKESESFLRHCKLIGFTDLEVKGIFVDGEQDDTHLDEVKAEFSAVFQDKPVALTPDQKRIAELEAKLEALIAGGKPPKAKASEPQESTEKEEGAQEPEKKQTKAAKAELEKLRAEYRELLGKEPHNFAGVDKLKQAIRNHKINQ